nr:MAG TPA: hypothetical protein [Caudoviricetes sp.]
MNREKCHFRWIGKKCIKAGALLLSFLKSKYFKNFKLGKC